MNFDGAVIAKGDGSRIWLLPPKNRIDFPLFYSYNLYFDCTNNVAEYEALFLGLNILKKLKYKKGVNYGDSELVIIQVNGIYQTKHHILRSYRDLVLDLLEKLKEYMLFVLPKN